MAARRFGKEVDADGGRAMKESRGDQTEWYSSAIDNCWPPVIIWRQRGRASNTQKSGEGAEGPA